MGDAADQGGGMSGLVDIRDETDQGNGMSGLVDIRDAADQGDGINGSVDIRDAADQGDGISGLVDIRDVKIDRRLPIEERMRSYVQQIKNPYCFRVGDVKVRVSYATKDRTLEDSFSAMVASMQMGDTFHGVGKW